MQHVGQNLAARGDPTALVVIEDAVRRAAAEHGTESAESAYALFCLGFARGVAGDVPGSVEAYAESAQICRSKGERWWLGWLLQARGFLALMVGDDTTLRNTALEGLELLRAIPDTQGCVAALSQSAIGELGRDDRRAAYLLGTCARYWKDAGGFMLTQDPWASVLAQARQRCRDALGDEAYDAEHDRGSRATVEDGMALLLGEATAPRPSRSAGNDVVQALLTRREREIAGLLAEGHSNREIATRPVLSHRTVDTHVQNILTKTGFTSRTQVAAWFVRSEAARQEADDTPDGPDCGGPRGDRTHNPRIKSPLLCQLS